ncbi:MAG: carboxypeptidase-like regulatory domain-containing protein [Algoriphagus sp.]|nr:carboxypeptidase-like regulatory domain-containing protein [Algoriphagus sp.]
MRHLFSIVLLLLPLTISAQIEFRGRVLDSTSRSGVPYSTVFLTGTTVGISTDEQGYFFLQIPEGSYEVLVRMLGYEPKIFRIATTEMQKEAYQIFLTPAYPELDFLEVEDQRDPVWFENLKIFNQFFLGTSRNGKASRILNQNILHLDSDSEPQTLKVTAPDLLQIENSNLGYRVEFLLEEFTYSLRSKSFYVSGYPQFIAVTTLKRSRANRVEANRRKAYQGSLQHLVWSLYEGNADEEGFEFSTVIRNKNPERPEQSQIDTAKERFALTTNSDEKDSLNQNFLQKERLNPYIDKHIYEPVPESVLVRIDEKGHKYLTFDHLLHVTYTKELESKEYLRQFAPRTPRGQRSILILSKGEMEIFKNGTYGNRSGIFLEGYMGWEKIGELMPLDYTLKE